MYTVFIKQITHARNERLMKTPTCSEANLSVKQATANNILYIYSNNQYFISLYFKLTLQYLTITKYILAAVNTNI